VKQISRYANCHNTSPGSILCCAYASRSWLRQTRLLATATSEKWEHLIRLIKSVRMHREDKCDANSYAGDPVTDVFNQVLIATGTYSWPLEGSRNFIIGADVRDKLVMRVSGPISRKDGKGEDGKKHWNLCVGMPGQPKYEPIVLIFAGVLHTNGGKTWMNPLSGRWQVSKEKVSDTMESMQNLGLDALPPAWNVGANLVFPTAREFLLDLIMSVWAVVQMHRVGLEDVNFCLDGCVYRFIREHTREENPECVFDAVQLGGARNRKPVKSVWRGTGQKDGRQRALYVNASRPGDIRIRRMVRRGDRTVATYVEATHPPRPSAMATPPPRPSAMAYVEATHPPRPSAMAYVEATPPPRPSAMAYVAP
jgi:hypothetical protein